MTRSNLCKIYSYNDQEKPIGSWTTNTQHSKQNGDVEGLPDELCGQMVSSLYLFLSLLISLSNFNPFSETMRSKVKQNIKYILVYSCIPLFYIRRSVLTLTVLCSPFSHYFMTA